ncbi:MAG: HD domain-containing protein [Lachnospiraceae bacterium]|nr:HD domain-containing protein [Lachnospiraceae bacterium]
MKTNKKLRLLPLITLLFLLPVLLPPASADAAPSHRRDLLQNSKDYTAILYDSSNGLPTSEANAIVQGSDGFIWMGGYSGLIRYDGTSFQRYDSTTGVSSVFSLYVDSRGILWVGTNENGVASIDHGELHVYGKTEGIKSHSIRSIIEDPDGNILIGTTQGLAYVDSEMELHPINDPQLNTEYISRLQRDPSGRVFGLTNDGALFEVKDLHVSAFYEPDEFGDTLNAIYADPTQPGLLYAGTVESELLELSITDNVKVTKRRNTGSLRNINAFQRAGNVLWICTTSGIGFMDEGGHFDAIADVPNYGSVGSVMQDYEGNIWFTSTRQGVLKLVPNRFSDISRMAGLDTMVVNSTCINNELLYLGCDDGLRILDQKTNSLVENELSRELKGIRIRCIKNDSDGNVWICCHSDDPLIRYSPENGVIRRFNADDGLDVTRVRTCLELSDGRLAAATGEGLFLLKNDKVVSHYGQDNGISTTEILSVAEGYDGKLYLGSDGDGVYVVNGNSVSRLGLEDGLTSGVVMRIKRDDERKLLWFITSNSIEYMDAAGGTITPVTTFPYSNNYDIYFDTRGGAWILSSNGVYITRVDELLADKNIEYSFYNTKSGLPCIATGNSRSHLGSDGILYISGTTGVCSVDINARPGNNASIRLAIPSIEVDDRVIPAENTNSVTVPAGSQRVVINAFALTYGLSNPRIRYYLESFDENPIITTKQDMHPFVYTNLDGGRYVFHLELINEETGAVENSTSILIIKESSLYENTLFWVLLMIGLIAGVYFFVASRFKHQQAVLLEKQQKDREFITQIMHTIAKCVDLRDTMNIGHSFRVAYYTRLLATRLAPLKGYDEEEINEFYNIALLHDIGKIGIPDAILNKPERLNDDEYRIMKSHTKLGEDLLRDVDIVRNLALGAGYHHERLDGKGYPRGLEGEEIPDVARIVAVADTFDAMYSTRPYRKQMLLSDVLAEFKRIRGTQLDPDVVDALMELAEENLLDKDKVDAWVENVKAPRKSEESENTDEDDDADDLARRNREFMESLDFGKATHKSDEEE